MTHEAREKLSKAAEAAINGHGPMLSRDEGEALDGMLQAYEDARLREDPVDGAAVCRCVDCGDVVRYRPARGQTRILRADPRVEVPIPESVLVPTCARCAEVYFAPPDAARVDAACWRAVASTIETAYAELRQAGEENLRETLQALRDEKAAHARTQGHLDDFMGHAADQTIRALQAEHLGEKLMTAGRAAREAVEEQLRPYAFPSTLTAGIWDVYIADVIVSGGFRFRDWAMDHARQLGDALTRATGIDARPYPLTRAARFLQAEARTKSPIVRNLLNELAERIGQGDIP